MNLLTRLAALFALALITMAGLAAPVAAQNLFAPAIRVNDSVITQYELNQRARMLQLFRAPGDPVAEARRQLIEERLKLEAAKTSGISPTQDDIAAGMEEFAGRANMTAEQFLRALEGGGVAEQTFRDFVAAGVAWRQLVRARFAPRVQISEAQVDRALSSTGAGSVRVLLSEIILPAQPGREAAAQARAQEISQITSVSAFSSAARRYSASGSRGRGGRLNWMPITNLPPQVQTMVLGLAPGQVTQPIPIQGGIALFQMREIEEGAPQAPEYAAIEYAAYYIDGGRSERALATAQKIRDSVDTCDDLYGVAKGQPEQVLERGSKAPAEIPTDIAIELAKLDKHEVSTNLTRAGGQTLVFLMLCGRTPAIAESISREDVTLSLQNRRLDSFARGYLEELRAEARIIEK
ncbi:peptidylprolyl isomerase [Marimonas lutisalis]|uniref:peptidylprolyl isomerase n=1 Tax=Marimonas lutisalis TaxID=2545756 RepID=UPI0010F9B556|nr:peptidylprolyl isomerase [Marimonas lutisalis]